MGFLPESLHLTPVCSCPEPRLSVPATDGMPLWSLPCIPSVSSYPLHNGLPHRSCRRFHWSVSGYHGSFAVETRFLPHWLLLLFLLFSEVLLYIFHLFPVPVSGVPDPLCNPRSRIYRIWVNKEKRQLLHLAAGYGILPYPEDRHKYNNPAASAWFHNIWFLHFLNEKYADCLYALSLPGQPDCRQYPVPAGFHRCWQRWFPYLQQ